MAEKLKLKSRAVKVYDFRQTDISQFLTGFVVNEAQYKKDLERVLYRFGKKEQVTQVSLGDMVTISSSSVMPRFNKNKVPLVVGRGLLNPVIESALVGMAVGESKVVKIGAIDVTLTVRSAVHTTLPELTDENVAAFGMEGVSTVADLRKYCVGKQVETFVLEDENPDMASAYVWQEIAKHSVIERDADEVAFELAKAAKKKAELDELPVEKEAAGIDLAMLEEMFLNELDLAAIGQEMMEADGVALTEDDYVAWIDKQQKAYPDKTRAELEQETDRTEFMVNRYAEYVAHELDLYVASVFKAHFTKE